MPVASAGAELQVESEAPVTATELTPPEAHNSPTVAVDPTDSRFAAIASRVDAPGFGCGLEVSGDAGRSWVPAEPVPALPPQAERCYAPEIAFDADGVLYYVFVGLAGEGNSPVGVFLTTSSDRAKTFTTPAMVLGPENYQVDMAIETGTRDHGRIHLVWLQASTDAPLGGLPPPPNPILAAYSDDGGSSFSDPVQVNDQARQRAVAPALALGPNDMVHVVYYDLHDDARDYQGLTGPVWPGRWSLVLASSYDGGNRFQPGVVVNDDVVPPERVMLIFTMPTAAMATDEKGGLYVAWYDLRNNDWDVFLARSTDQGRSWNEPLRVNDDGIGNGRHQYLPQLGSTANRLDVIFYDRRDDPDNLRNDVYYTYSRDGGHSFAPNVKLTSKSSDSSIGQRYQVPSAEGLVEFGSRLGLHSGPEAAVAAWTDTRNAFPGINQQDIFSTRVVFGTGSENTSRWPLPPQLLGLAVLVFSAMGLVMRQRRRVRPNRSEAAIPSGATGRIRGRG